MKSHHVLKVFFACAIVLLSCTGVGKIIAFFEPVPQYSGNDPIFSFFTMRQVLLIGGVAELLLVALILKLNPVDRKAVPLLCFSSAVLLYRAGFKILGISMPCHCLGYLNRFSPFNSTETDSVMLIFAVILLIGSLLALTGFGQKPESKRS